MRPRIAKPRFEYSYAVSGARWNGTPAWSRRVKSASGIGVWRSPQGSSVTKPAAWLRRSRTVIFGESPLG
jgi:hypothetical protein